MDGSARRCSAQQLEEPTSVRQPVLRQFQAVCQALSPVRLHPIHQGLFGPEPLHVVCEVRGLKAATIDDALQKGRVAGDEPACTLHTAKLPKCGFTPT